MARVIRFHVPEGYKASRRWTSPENYGKLLQFPARPARKPALAAHGPATMAKLMPDIPVLRKMPIL